MVGNGGTTSSSTDLINAKRSRSRLNLLLKSKKKPLEEEYIWAVRTRDVPEIYQCLERGVHPTTIIEDLGISTFHMLAERNDYEIARHIMEYTDVDLNVTSVDDGCTPLHIACYYNNVEFIKMLIEKGADVDRRDRYGRTALHVAVKRECTKLVVTLIKAGATVNTIDIFENTLLSTSIILFKNRLLSKILLHYGADMRLESERNLHIFFEAVLHCNTLEQIKLISLLLDHGVNVNTIDGVSGRNCLHFVAITGYLELAIFLVKRRAKRNISDYTKRTPQKIASDHGNCIMADYLKKGYRPPHILTLIPSLLRFSHTLKERVAHRKAEEEKEIIKSREGSKIFNRRKE